MKTVKTKSDQTGVPSPDSWVHRQPGGVFDPRLEADQIGTREEQERAKQLGYDIAERQVREQKKPRENRFLPFLLVRTAIGDRGDRPLPGVFWESPDIWVAPGEPAVTPDLPPSHGGSVVAGAPTTVYAHVWNLGMAPIAGVHVEFYWHDPSLGIDGSSANLIGVATVELGPRTSPTCHRLVKCPSAWVPVMANGGHECLVVRVRSVGDGFGPNPWQPKLNRHVAQRNMSVVDADARVLPLLDILDRSRDPEGSLQLVQVGRAEAPPLTILRPTLQVDPRVETLVLAEVRANGRIFFPATKPSNPAAGAAVGRAGLTTAAAPDRGPVEVARVVPSDFLRDLRVRGGGPADPPGASTLERLFRYVQRWGRRDGQLLRRLPPPASDFGQVLRIANFSADGQLVGGYTLVLRG